MRAASGGSGKPTVVTPMPGKVVKVLVQNGETVQCGQPLMILEAMKMEHIIRAPQDAEVESVFFESGDFVEDGRCLLDFVAAEE